ncbi:MAG: redoxin domain-containing protein [Gemmatimonadetes bacterium]|nr:redoxin domain-containing protein [Gemmatimonadota bacterium]NIQ55146.1 redoxin domain-containing protein [Gemmatimonadota bacterium]NIU75348.1 redoxin domain-containing protein [Gammaproteobacteria bacterium]NIX45120.1 redoxin domain-containing protein [Gemmatimonadota bacterium]NIY09371.1 redoxin domain-containing protein [Gemmatimonadota bacterium]
MHAYRDQYAQLFNLGQDVVLIAISADPIEELASWAHDDDFPFLMASDAELEVASRYGAIYERGDRRGTNRNLFVIGPDGRIAYTATPFREIDPTAYEELEAAIDRIAAEADPGTER